MRRRGHAVRGRPLGKCHSYADTQLFRYLAEISVKHGIDSHSFFNSFVYASQHQKSKCGQLSIERRTKTRGYETFLVMNGSNVVTQFRISEALLKETDPLEEFIPEILPEEASVKRLRIQDIKIGMRGITLMARVLEIPEPRMVFTQFGQAKVTSALIADETGTIRLTLWDKQIDLIPVDSLIMLENCRAIMFRGERQLNVGKKGQMRIIQGTDYPSAKELKINHTSKSSSGRQIEKNSLEN